MHGSMEIAGLVEKDILVTILERQASRLSKKSFISEQDLKQIEVEDLPVTKKTETVEDTEEVQEVQSLHISFYFLASILYP